jgi:DNA polymerase-1
LLVYDIETDGLLDDATVVHCINVIDRKTGTWRRFNGGVYRDGTPAPRDGTIEDGLKLLEEADEIGGINVNWFDNPALRKLYPRWRPRGRVRDALVEARVIWPDVKDRDFNALSKGRLPQDFQKQGLIGKHSLASWGYRLGVFKGEFDPKNFTNPETGEPHTWKTIGFTPEMAEYGKQDVVVTLHLFDRIDSKQYSAECLELEHAVNLIVFRQHERGFAVDMDAINALTAKLQKRHAEIGDELQRVFRPWYMPDVAKGTALVTTKKGRREFIADENGPKLKKQKDKTLARGHFREFTEGSQYTKVKHVVFNPASRDHIADRLMKLRRWQPGQFTDGGKAQIDETILEALPWPEAKLLSEYLMIEKRLGQVATGKESWLKHAVRTGIYGADGSQYRIHGSVNTNGAVTGRMTHSYPNVAQTPRVGTPFGEDCRACFVASPGLVLVGCDAEGIELRCLAHYMAKYDDGAYVETVVNGRKENESDVHNVNKRAAGLNKRDSSKTFIYALIYGAGDYKLGCVVYDDFTDEQRERFNTKYPTKNKRAAALKRLGGARRARLMENLPALGKLVDAVKKAAKTRGYLRGLDGRLLHVRAEHSALNTLLQSAGAVLMKKALVLLDKSLDNFRYSSTNFAIQAHIAEFVANVHDEWQIETEEEIADDVGRIAAEAIKRAGEHFKFRCPLAGSYGIGRNWKETH